MTSRGAFTTDVMLAGNWKTSRMVARRLRLRGLIERIPWSQRYRLDRRMRLCIAPSAYYWHPRRAFWARSCRAIARLGVGRTFCKRPSPRTIASVARLWEGHALGRVITESGIRSGTTRVRWPQHRDSSIKLMLVQGI